MTKTGQKWPQLAQTVHTGKDNLGENKWSQNVVCQYWPQNSAEPTCLGHLVYSHHYLIEKKFFNSGSRNNGSACPYPPPHCLGSEALWEYFTWRKTLASILRAKFGGKSSLWVASSRLGNLLLFVLQLFFLTFFLIKAFAQNACTNSKYVINTTWIGCSYLDIRFGNRLQVFNEDPHLPSPAMSHGNSCSGDELGK